MKTRRLTIAAIIIAASVSCQKETTVGTDAVQTLEKTTLSTLSTRTSLNGNDVHWTSDDVIAVFDNSGKKNTFSIAECNGSAAEFNGYVTTGTTNIFAVYPHELAESADGSTLVVNIPSDQTAKSGSFAEEHNISVAKADKTPGEETVDNVSFKNACAYLKFTVPAYISDVKSVTLSADCAIAGKMTIDFSGETPAMRGVEGSNSITMNGDYPVGSTFWFVLAPVTLDGFTVSITTESATWQSTRTSQVALAAGKYRNLGTLELEKISAASAEATHTYSNGTLTGTDIKVNLNIPSSAASYVTVLELQVKNSAGKVVRTLSKSTPGATETIAANSDWPYLPKGEYTISGSYTLSGNTVKEIEAVSFTSPAPTFSVTSNAYSSYTKYNAGQSSVANGCIADKIYDINKASVTISSNILENGNYSDIVGGYTYRLDNNATTASEATGQSWGPHTVTATYTFDGISNSGSSNCHITGLPYTLNPAANDSVNAWAPNDRGNVAWNTDGGVRIGYNLSSWSASTSTDITKSFNLPSDIKIVVNSTGTSCGSGSKGSWIDSRKNTTFTLSVSGSNVYQYTTTDGGTAQSYSTGDKSATMTSSNPSIKCHNSYSTASGCTTIKTMTVKYGNK